MLDYHGRDEAEIMIRAYVPNPETISDPARLEYWGSSAAERIVQLQQAIKDLKDYQNQVFRRLQTIYTAPYHLKISLTREKRYNDKVFYFLTTEKVFDDPTLDSLQTDSKKYIGTDRAQAIKDYRAALKSHPGVDCEINIAKSKWERQQNKFPAEHNPPGFFALHTSDTVTHERADTQRIL